MSLASGKHYQQSSHLNIQLFANTAWYNRYSPSTIQHKTCWTFCSSQYIKSYIIPSKGKPQIIVLHGQGVDIFVYKKCIGLPQIMENTCGQHYVTLSRKVLKRHIVFQWPAGSNTGQLIHHQSNGVFILFMSKFMALQSGIQSIILL